MARDIKARRNVSRMTFVGVAECGCAQFLAQDPATYRETPRDEGDEWRSLVDDLRHYARHGQIKLVTDDELTPWVESMKTCNHSGPAMADLARPETP